MVFSKALIVDDSKLARVTLKKKLESLGLDVVVAESAEQAYKTLETTPIDIVFMDHLMPDIDGFQATQQLRKNGLQLPIIMCTGKEHDGYLDEALAIGANYILSKPPVDEDLAAVLSMQFASAVMVSQEDIMTVDDFDLSALEQAIDDVATEEDIPTIEQSLEYAAEELLFSDDMDLSWLNQQQGASAESQKQSMQHDEIVAQSVAEEPLLVKEQDINTVELQAEVERYIAEGFDQLEAKIITLQEQLDASTVTSHQPAVIDEDYLHHLVQQQNEQYQSVVIAELMATVAGLEEKLNTLSEIPPAVNDAQSVDKQELEMLVQTSIDTSRAVIIEELGENIRQLQQQLDEMPIASSSADGERELLIRMEEILHPRIIEIKSNLLDDIDQKMQKDKERDFDELLELRLNVLLGERIAGINQRIKTLEQSKETTIPTMAAEGVVSNGVDEQAQIERFRQSEKLTRHLDQLIEENALFANRIQQIRQLSIAAAAAAGASLVVSLIHYLIG